MPFSKLISNLINIEKQIPHIFDKTVMDNTHILVDYVVTDQQFEKGVGGTGRSLGDYTPVTVKIKKLKGQPTNRVTGRDTGKMHQSSHIKLQNHKFSIENAGEQYMKDFEERYKDERPNDIMDENLQDFITKYVKPDLIKGILKLL